MQVDLDTVNTGVKSAMPIIKAVSGQQQSNEFEWLDRLANILDKVTQFAKVYQQGGLGGQSRQEQINGIPPQNYVETRLAPPMPINDVRVNEDKDKQMQVIKLLIPIFEQYIDKCIAENPKMSIGEAISKLDIINISDAKEMLRQYKQSQGVK